MGQAGQHGGALVQVCLMPGAAALVSRRQQLNDGNHFPIAHPPHLKIAFLEQVGRGQPYGDGIRAAFRRRKPQVAAAAGRGGNGYAGADTGTDAGARQHGNIGDTQTVAATGATAIAATTVVRVHQYMNPFLQSHAIFGPQLSAQRNAEVGYHRVVKARPEAKPFHIRVHPRKGIDRQSRAGRHHHSSWFTVLASSRKPCSRSRASIQARSSSESGGSGSCL